MRLRWLPNGKKNNEEVDVSEQNPAPVRIYANSDSNPLVVLTGYRIPGTLTATIATGENKSSEILIPDGYRIDELFFGTGWVGKISFQSSPEGTVWSDQLENGASIQESPVEGCSLPLKPDVSLRVSKKYIRLQSGVMGDLVNQTSDQTIKISLISM